MATNFNMENLYDLDMERAILSSIISDNDVLGEIYDIIEANDFYLSGHSDIYRAMIACLNSDSPIATTFLKNKLGDKYNDTIMADVIGTNSIVDITRYAKELKEKSVKRGLVKIAQQMPGKVNEDKYARDMVDEISADLYSLVDGENGGVIRQSNEIIYNVVEYIKKQAELDVKGMVGLDTGFRDLNERTNGFKRGDLIIIAARPGMGKTALCLNFISHVLNQNLGVVFFSLEMPAEQIMMRMLSAKTSIPLQDIINPNMTDDQLSRLNDACGQMAEKMFFVHDSGYVNIHQVRTQLRKLKATHPEISLCVIDYIGLMMSTSNYNERHLQIAEISRGLKLLARELDMPIIALSQLNRSLESRANKRPMLSDLRESGAIEQDADMILFVYRDEVYKEQEEKEKEQQAKIDGKEISGSTFKRSSEEKAEIIIGKNRNGEPGIVNVVFQSRFTRFVDPIPKPSEMTEFSG
ncbi:MAG: replicative DNA helicase [Campylobacter sp.]|nr:replicative DNA helicase [Campylobacter sp.]